MTKTMQALITDVEHALYQSAGPNVQVYAQDTILRLITNAYKHCYKQAFYPQYRKRETRILDGSTGQVTVPLTFITDWEDLQHVFRVGSDRPLPVLPASFNTLNDPPTATVPRFIEANGTSKLVTIYPITSKGSVQFVGRLTAPSEFGLTTVVPFDDVALVHFAAWAYYTDDGSNPASAAKHQGLFEARMKTIMDNSFSHSVQLNPSTGDVPDRWYER